MSNAYFTCDTWYNSLHWSICRRINVSNAGVQSYSSLKNIYVFNKNIHLLHKKHFIFLYTPHALICDVNGASNVANDAVNGDIELVRGISDVI